MSAARDGNVADAQRWLRQAEEHLASAEWSGRGGQWASACFWCQQAGELALKALLVWQGARRRTHGVLHLVETLSGSYPQVAALADAARCLDRFYVPTRYPDALPTGTTADYFSEADFHEGCAAARTILQAAKGLLASG